MIDADEHLVEEAEVISSQSLSQPYASPDGNITATTYPGPALIYTRTKKPVDIINRARALLGPGNANWFFSSDSTKIATMNGDSLIAIYELGPTTDAVQEITTIYTCPSDLPISNMHGIIDSSGWLYSHTGRRMLWIPQTDRKIWALLASGRLILENNEGQLVVVDLEDYLKFPQVRRAWSDQNFTAKAHRGAAGLGIAVNRMNIIHEFARRETGAV
ncbi:hypothetical protein DFH07DRAFT_114922 [Mycena maculata]|uniref:Uncharacterized protein n=1 Tax=Mycena maculata TaxID=230809 RepID=A0AAD7MVQ8_9AGAR|nr:hypothetical protein DFH07DRAFT_114922 [Mycena maculata]